MSNSGVSKAEWERRKLLVSLGGGLGTLAGCVGDDTGTDDTGDDGGPPTGDGTGDEDGTSPTVEQEFIASQAANPEETHLLYLIPERSTMDTRYSHALWGPVYQATQEPPFWSRNFTGGGLRDDLEALDNALPLMLEDWEITPRTLSATIREDAYWSDGEPVRAFDAVAQSLMWAEPTPEHGWSPPPEEQNRHALYRVNMPDGRDGKRYEFSVPDTPEWEDIGEGQGWYFNLAYTIWWLGQASNLPRLAPMWPTHDDRLAPIAEGLLEVYENREVPTDQDGQPVPIREHVIDQHISEGMIESSRENPPPTLGAWQWDEIVGTEGFRLVPNEHYRHADALGYDEVFVSYIEEEMRTRAAAFSGRLDYSSFEAPPAVLNEVPDKYQQLTTPDGGGPTINLAHTGHWADRRVRWATNFALNKPDIAGNIHPDLYQPVTIPGRHMWEVGVVADVDRMEENFIDFSQDLDRAEQLMQDAGYSRNADGIWAKDGNEIVQPFPTDVESPVWEETVASQLRDFGMGVETVVLDGDVYLERRRGDESDHYYEEEDGGSGDYQIMSGRYGSFLAADFYPGLHGYLLNTNNSVSRLRQHSWWPHEVVEDTAQTYWSTGDAHSHGRSEMYRDLVMELPPIGEPNGEPEEFAPLWTSNRVIFGPFNPEDPQPENPTYNPPHDEPHPENAEYFWMKLAWTLNWWLPVIPLALPMSMHFLNRDDWLWANDIQGESVDRLADEYETDNEFLWDTFGLGRNVIGMQLATGRIHAKRE